MGQRAFECGEGVSDWNVPELLAVIVVMVGVMTRLTGSYVHSPAERQSINLHM
jgi:hypothetical protein